MEASGVSPKDQLILEIRETIQSIEARLKENQNILEQNQLEVDRLQQRQVASSRELKMVEDNFDTIPRDDMRKAYENAIETRTRLVSMRSQLEKLQDTQGYMEEYRDKLQELLSLLGAVTLERLGSGDNGRAQAISSEQIIRIVETQEFERKVLANALHDGPAQSLTNFILQAEICLRLFKKSPENAETELNNLKTMASFSFQKIREFIFELRPMMLDDLGLVATVKRHIENYDEKFDDKEVTFQMTGPGDSKRFPSHVEVMMFRTYQMLINNALNVLGADTVNVKLDVDEKRLFGTVEDNGRFVNVETELDPKQSESPLHNVADMRERIEMLGGKLQMFSTEGQGNVAEITLPYETIQAPEVI